MDFKSKHPIYLQIAEQICGEILRGAYPEGGRLPSVREYAALVEVNVNTLVRSYDWLSQQSIIFNRRGLGYFVAEGATEHIMQIRRREFLDEWLPELVQRMRTLGISVEEVERRIDELENENKDNV